MNDPTNAIDDNEILRKTSGTRASQHCLVGGAQDVLVSRATCHLGLGDPSRTRDCGPVWP